MSKDMQAYYELPCLTMQTNIDGVHREQSKAIDTGPHRTPGRLPSEKTLIIPTTPEGLRTESQTTHTLLMFQLVENYSAIAIMNDNSQNTNS